MGKIIPRFISKLGLLVPRYFELEPKPHGQKRGRCGKKGVKRGKRKKEEKKKKELGASLVAR